ncbi:MAG: hypothetical protein HY831_04785 [Candidatus Aenigmarchaeota archaeon]|nr:hypothetical protein [Candidatus Aenigmarchaeota archaeon]
MDKKYFLYLSIFAIISVFATVGFATFVEQPYTPPNNLVYGGPYNYTNPLYPNGASSAYCIDPSGAPGEIRIFGINQKGQYQCINGLWIYIGPVGTIPYPGPIYSNVTNPIFSLVNETCTLPVDVAEFRLESTDNSKIADFPITIINNKNVSVAYNINVTKEPGRQFGDAGFPVIVDGRTVLVNSKMLVLLPGQKAQIDLLSGFLIAEGTKFTDYKISVLVSNSTFNVSKELQFIHNVFRKTAVKLNYLSESLRRVTEARPETYVVRITNPIPYKSCGPNTYYLLKEVPEGWSARIEVDGETDVLTLASLENVEARFTVNPNPNNLQPGKRYESNLIVTQDLPTDIASLVGANDLKGIDVDPSFIYLIADNRILLVDKLTLSSVIYNIKGGLGIAVDSTSRGNIYWSDVSGSISCSSKIRFSPTRIVKNVYTNHISVSDNYIYFSQADGLYRAIKDCTFEQLPEKLYSYNGIKDVSVSNNVIYWLEQSSNRSVIKSIGESQISSRTISSPFTVAEKDSDMIYIIKGSGRVGASGRNGIFYATGGRTGRVAVLNNINDSIIMAGVGSEPIVSFVRDIAVDNSSVYWIQNGVKRMDLNNQVEYLTFYYEYIAEKPTIKLLPSSVQTAAGSAVPLTLSVTNNAGANIKYSIFMENVPTDWRNSFSGILEQGFAPRETKNYQIALVPNSATSKSFRVCARATSAIWPESATSNEFQSCTDIFVNVPKPPPQKVEIWTQPPSETKAISENFVLKEVSLKNNVYTSSPMVPNNWSSWLDIFFRLN